MKYALENPTQGGYAQFHMDTSFKASWGLLEDASLYDTVRETLAAYTRHVYFSKEGYYSDTCLVRVSEVPGEDKVVSREVDAPKAEGTERTTYIVRSNIREDDPFYDMEGDMLRVTHSYPSGYDSVNDAVSAIVRCPTLSGFKLAIVALDHVPGDPILIATVVE